MKYEEVMIGLKQGKYAPAYMLCGKEPYYIDLVANYIENNVLDEMAREFDQTIIYGKDLSGGDVSPVIGAARGFAMMGGYKVIIVKEAQNIKKWEALAMYMDNPQPSTTRWGANTTWGTPFRSNSYERPTTTRTQAAQPQPSTPTRTTTNQVMPIESIYSAGERIEHKVFGPGTVNRVYRDLVTENDKIEITFDKVGTKTHLLSHAKLERL